MTQALPETTTTAKPITAKTMAMPASTEINQVITSAQTVSMHTGITPDDNLDPLTFGTVNSSEERKQDRLIIVYIVGAVLGCLILLVIILFLFIFCCHKHIDKSYCKFVIFIVKFNCRNNCFIIRMS